MNPTSSESTLTFEKLKAVVEKYAPPPPYRWMVRRDGLSAKQNLFLDVLCLPERVQPSKLLPDGAIAIIFEEEPGHAFPRTFSHLWIVKDPENEGLPADQPVEPWP